MSSVVMCPWLGGRRAQRLLDVRNQSDHDMEVMLTVTYCNYYLSSVTIVGGYLLFHYECRAISVRQENFK